MPVPKRQIVKPFQEQFFTTIDEVTNPDSSNSPYFHVTSGGFFDISRGTLKTNQQNMPLNHKWRAVYAKSNPVDTADGISPENIARVITRQDDFQDFSFSTRFLINKVNLTDSPNRNVSNGVLLMAHYASQDDLYYIGVRVDGQVIIKRKAEGVYSTLAAKPWFSGTYHRDMKPCLIPINSWITLKAYVKSLNGVTSLSLYISDPGSTTLRLAISVSDVYPALAVPGRVGVRSDFMRIEFDDITIS